jgi:hypothetical protein
MSNQADVFLNRIAEREAAGYSKHQRKMKEALAAAAGPEAAGGKFQSQIMGVAEARSKIIANIFSDKGDKTEQQLKKQEEANKTLKQIATNTANGSVARAAAP